ncbi:hypothetical protein GYH30_029235 [Glycine max]|uniref:Uncharacterized protein n=1 Tax=Glycine max TaxID=3847 RepID=A0A0R0I6W5_SOYBN|nr:hypothetical protein GYH30_029235 [Glycine max]
MTQNTMPLQSHFAMGTDDCQLYKFKLAHPEDVFNFAEFIVFSIMLYSESRKRFSFEVRGCWPYWENSYCNVSLYSWITSATF